MHHPPRLRISSALPPAALFLIAFQPDAVQAAACATPPASPGNQTISAPEEIVVPGGLAVGDIIGTAYSSEPRFTTPSINCGPWFHEHFYTRPYPPWQNFIHETNVPGIGVKIYRSPNYSNGRPIPYTFNQDARLDLNNEGYRVEFYKIGDLQEGTLSPGRYAQSNIDGAYSISLALPAIRFLAATPTCDLGQVTDVNLGQVPASVFTGIGSASDWVHFSIDSLSCTAVNTISMTFSGTADATDPTLFASTGTASSVAIELRSSDEQPAVPNAASPITFPGAPGPASHGLKVRAKQTGSAVMAGSISTTITANVTYD